MMQKIKYPVGSKLRNSKGEIKCLDLSKDGYVAFFEEFSQDITKNSNKVFAFTQQNLDHYGYTLVSSPRWKPEMGSDYYFLTDDGEIDGKFWKNDETDQFRLKNDNVKQTFKECQKKIDEINSREI